MASTPTTPPSRAPSIGPDEWLYRRFPVQWYDKVKDQIQTRAFDDLGGEAMSVYVASQVKDPADVAGAADPCLVRFKTSLALELGQRVFYAPGDHDAHAHVAGNKTRSVLKSFRSHCEWVIKPD